MLTFCREIIDESDVFVDVHKAIRRMAPAPKSRVPKGRIVEDPPMLPAETTLVEVDNESPAPPNGAPKDHRRLSVEAPLPRFQLRRPTSDKNSDSTDGLFTHRGATDEIRQHLKHLGPSNLASRPRQTRYQNVKIKRSASPSRSGQTDLESSQSMSDVQPRHNSIGLQGGIGAGLVQSGMDARDGVYAVRAGYGTMNHSNPPADAGTQTKDGLPISIPEPVHEEQDDHPRSAGSRTGSARSIDSQSEHLKPGSYLHRGPARSGSITEQVVDVNGIRKVVLHTTSTSSSESERPRTSENPEFPVRQEGEIVDLGNNQSAGNKRRRRRRKRGQGPKNGESGENTPLLSQ